MEAVQEHKIVNTSGKKSCSYYQLIGRTNRKPVAYLSLSVGSCLLSKILELPCTCYSSICLR